MIECPECATPSLEACRYCSQCGMALSGSDSDIGGTVLANANPPSGSGSPTAKGSLTRSRMSSRTEMPSRAETDCRHSSSLASIASGSILADRYRIIGRIGTGGMGEVYKADDLKVGQVVALKFLSAAYSRDEKWLERFHTEVRIARQISHPNVCHVYDIGDVDGVHFISMEYVAGEDLASLLRQIGRFPRDKAIEISLQLCAGLATVHGRGILHRDLKPANIMIDDDGSVRITDFGLADRLGEEGGAGVGTPNYMAPELLKGERASIKSDIYSLGLVLYEMYTGKRAFESDSLAELCRLRSESGPVRPSTVFRECDPSIERLLLVCLEVDPERRPSSVIEVITALPGGEALAQALSGGEEPAKRVISSARAEVVRPAWALCGLIGLIGGIALVILLSSRAMLHRRVGLETSPEVLAARAATLLRSMGHGEGVVDSAFGFQINWDALHHLEGPNGVSLPGVDRWDRLGLGHPSAVQFWYRESPRHLRPNDVFAGGRVSAADPPPNTSLMATVVLDPSGEMVKFQAVPPRVLEAGLDVVRASNNQFDWATMFEASGLDEGSFVPCPSTWTPPVHADRRLAWMGRHPRDPDTALRVEAASFCGTPVYFEVIGPWNRGSQSVPAPGAGRKKVFEMLSLILFGEVMVAGVLLARRNLRLGRGDLRGAVRLAGYVFVVRIVAWMFQASHVPDFFSELRLFGMALGRSLYPAAILWVLYVALEPYVRRLWPRVLTSWSCLLAGRVRDPLVGRDLLFGAVVGVLWTLLFQVDNLAPGWIGLPTSHPLPTSVTSLLGVRHLLGDLLATQPNPIFKGLAFLLLLLLLRVLTRHKGLAAIAFFVISTVLYSFLSTSPVLGWVLSAIGSFFLLVLLLKLGVLAAIVAFLVSFMLLRFPLTGDLSSYYLGSSLLVCGLVVGLALYGFLISLGGRPLLRDVLFERQA